MNNNTSNIYSIYKITNLVNKKVYIGFTGQPPLRRFQRHIYTSNSKNEQYLIHKAIRKYNIDNFIFEVICQSKEADYAENELEPYFIKKYNCHYKDGWGYNMTYGGHTVSGYKCTEEEKKKKSQKTTQQWKDPIIRKKMLNRKGRKDTKHSIEAKFKMRETRKRIMTDELKEKYRQSSSLNKKLCVKNFSKKYQITCPDGRIENIINLSEYCRNHNLSIKMMNAIANNMPHRIQHKGFKCKRISTINNIDENI